MSKIQANFAKRIQIHVLSYFDYRDKKAICVCDGHDLIVSCEILGFTTENTRFVLLT